MHYETVVGTLEELFNEVEEREVKRAEQAKRDGAGDITRYERPQLLIVLNKADKDDVDEQDLLYWQSRAVGAIPLCALAGDPDSDTLPMGQEELIDRVKAFSIGPIEELEITVPMSDSKTIHTIENRAEVLSREYGEKTVTLRTKIGKNQLAKLRSAGAKMWVMNTDGEPYFRDDEKHGWVYDPAAIDIDF